MRRFLFRNDRALYRRVCGICGKAILSNFSEDSSPSVYCPECWWGDTWDSFQYSRDYDFSRPFFGQYQELVKEFPVLNAWNFNNERSDYTNYTGYSKNIYLAYSALYSENVFYSSIIDKSRDCVDCFKTRDSELCYWCADAVKAHNAYFLVNSRECINSRFLFDCVNCQNCFMSSNLRNKQFYFKNRSLSKDEYERAIAQVDLGSYVSIQNLNKEFENLRRNSIHKFSNMTNTVHSSGDNLSNTKNTLSTFDSWNTENVKYCWRIYNYKDTYDVSGSLNSELCYEASVAADHNYESKFYTHSRSTSNIQYSHLCPDSSYVFGCIGPRTNRTAS